MKKIVIVIPCKGREHVVSVSTRHLNEQVEAAKAYGLDIKAVWTHDDVALGQKLNNAIRYISAWEWDYVMILGSDDLVRPQIWGYVATAIGEGCRAFGFNEAVLYDRIGHRAKVWKYGALTFGAGRCIRRDVVEACGWNMWDDAKENGIDNNQEKRLWDIAECFIDIIPTMNPVICDIKDDDNLNSYDSIEGIAKPAYHIRNIFPDLNQFYADHT